jgi:hypothetical protein
MQTKKKHTNNSNGRSFVRTGEEKWFIRFLFWNKKVDEWGRERETINFHSAHVAVTEMT